MKAYEVITNEILKGLERGVVAWQRPWKAEILPQNYLTKKPYRGVNQLVLGLSEYDSPYWLTFNQVRKLEGKVIKGEKSTPIMFYSLVEKKGEDGKVKSYPCPRLYRVFNAEQIEGIDFDEIVSEPLEFDPIEKAEKIASKENMPSITFGGSSAFYQPTLDKVKLPQKENFVSVEEYYSTLFHELSHSTGHENRLNRKGVTDPIKFGSHEYSKEELVAEISTSFVMGSLGIDTTQTFNNSVAYINSWHRKLKNDNTLFIKCAGLAQKSADFLLGAA